MLNTVLTYTTVGCTSRASVVSDMWGGGGLVAVSTIRNTFSTAPRPKVREHILKQVVGRNLQYVVYAQEKRFCLSAYCYNNEENTDGCVQMHTFYIKKMAAYRILKCGITQCLRTTIIGKHLPHALSVLPQNVIILGAQTNANQYCMHAYTMCNQHGLRNTLKIER